MTIVNTNVYEDNALYVINQSPFDFYLGGSRRASQLAKQRQSDIDIAIQPETDYDFYATHSENIDRFLRSVGFKPTEYSYKCLRKGGGYQLDSEAIMILERDNVQVVLRKDAEFYYKVFESIPTDFYYKFLWKSSPFCFDRWRIQPIFEALFAAAHAMEDQTLSIKQCFLDF